MTAPLVSRLESSALAANDPVQKAICSAHIACYLARVGEFDEVERRRVTLRREFGDGRSAPVSILIMCVEALVLFYRGLDPGARDRLARANLLSVACRQPDLVALTYSWLAHIDFNLGNFESMSLAIKRCMHAIASDDGTALLRVSLVLGDALSFSGHAGGARKWYEQARLISTRLGDQAAIGAITYNRAALRVAAARLRSLTLQADDQTLAMLDAEVRSAVNYQSLARLNSLDHLLQSATIGVLMLQERYTDASEAIDRLLATSSVPVDSSELALLYADSALALMNSGHSDLAVDRAKAALAINADAFGADDKALLHGTLSDFSLAIGETTAAEHYRMQRDAALLEHEVTISSLTNFLEQYIAGPVTGP